MVKHRWLKISELPTVHDGGSRLHESVMRSHHIVREVRRLLNEGVPGSVVLELMDLMDNEERNAK